MFEIYLYTLIEETKNVICIIFLNVWNIQIN